MNAPAGPPRPLAPWLAVVFVLFRLCGLAGILLLVPLLLAVATGRSTVREIACYAVPFSICAILFFVSRAIALRGRAHLNRPAQGFACVVFGWVLFASIGALPYWISGVLPSYVDAWFESMSGFTTTGASVFTSVESLPRDIHLWRSMTQFIGGLGIIALFVAVLPALGAGGVVLFKSEVASSVLEDRLRPRIIETARVLWKIYAGLTGAMALALMLCGLSWFDAVCHAMTTLSTGGFSTRNLSFAAFSPAAQWVGVLFMALGGTSMLLHGKAVQGDLRAYLRSEEFRVYAAILLVAIAVLTGLVMASAEGGVEASEPTLDPHTRGEDHFPAALRDAAFQAVSIMTSTGFASADYDAWPDAARFLLVVLMFVGGCSGSTAGGAKVFRFCLVFRVIARQIVMLLSPTRVVSVRYDGAPVPRDALLAATALVLMFVLLAIVGAFSLMLLGVRFEEAASGVVSCLSCIGPALGDVGPTGNYAALPALAKVILSVFMLMGRLELYAVLVVFGLLRRR